MACGATLITVMKPVFVEPIPESAPDRRGADDVIGNDGHFPANDSEVLVANGMVDLTQRNLGANHCTRVPPGVCRPQVGATSPRMVAVFLSKRVNPAKGYVYCCRYYRYRRLALTVLVLCTLYLLFSCAFAVTQASRRLTVVGAGPETKCCFPARHGINATISRCSFSARFASRAAWWCMLATL